MPLFLFVVCLPFFSSAEVVSEQEKKSLNEIESILEKDEIYHPLSEQNDHESFSYRVQLPPIIIDPKDDLKRVIPIIKKQDTIDKLHEDFSRRILLFTNRVDQFFLDEKELDKDNGTRVRVYNTYTLLEGQGDENDLSFRLRLRLPYLTKKLHVAIERRDQTLEARAQSPENLGAISANQVNDDIQAGVGYVTKEKDWVNFRVTGGLRFDDSPYPFYKTRLFRDLRTENEDEYNISLALYWDERETYTQVFYINYNTKMTEKTLFRWTNEQQWTDEDDTLRTIHGPSFFHIISDNRFISYYARVFTTNRPNFQAENYRVGISYRQKIYKDWIFYELSPLIDFQNEQGHAPTPGVIFKIEGVFGDLKQT